jgi:hypothetical protein
MNMSAKQIFDSGNKLNFFKYVFLHEIFLASDFVKLWETTLNIVSLNQCVQDGHLLLRSMLGQANAEQVNDYIF